jgi:DNA-directed RNA polymerase subunit RPC12/RpoP
MISRRRGILKNMTKFICFKCGKTEDFENEKGAFLDGWVLNTVKHNKSERAFLCFDCSKSEGEEKESDKFNFSSFLNS